MSNNNIPKNSPFEAVHRRLGARMAEFHGWLLPGDFGNPESERSALKSRCAVFDLSGFGRVSIKGPGAERLVASVLSRTSGALEKGRWIWGAMEEGQIVRAARLGDEFFVFSRPEAAGGVLSGLCSAAETLEFSGLSVTDLSSQTAVLGLYGPGSYESLGQLLPIEDVKIELGSISRFSVMVFSFVLLGGSWLGGDGLELLCPNNLAPLAAGAIAKYHNKHDITPAGMDCLFSELSDMPCPV